MARTLFGVTTQYNTQEFESISERMCIIIRGTNQSNTAQKQTSNVCIQ
jgi:hypothetical protein